MPTNLQFIGSGEVARRCGIPRWRLLYLIESGQLPEASQRLAGRRLFTSADVARIAARLDELLSLSSSHNTSSSNKSTEKNK